MEIKLPEPIRFKDIKEFFEAKGISLVITRDLEALRRENEELKAKLDKAKWQPIEPASIDGLDEIIKSVQESNDRWGPTEFEDGHIDTILKAARMVAELQSNLTPKEK